MPCILVVPYTYAKSIGHQWTLHHFRNAAQIDVLIVLCYLSNDNIAFESFVTSNQNQRELHIWLIHTALKLRWQFVVMMTNKRFNHCCMYSNLYLLFSTRKRSSKPSVLSLMYCTVLSMILFSYGDWIRWWCNLKNLQAREYHVFHMLKQNVLHIFSQDLI
jgi:hypothetical protein